MAAASRWAVVLSCKQFKTLFQVVHQLPNFDASRLGDAGCSEADLDLFLTAVSSAKRKLAATSSVRLWAADNDAHISSDEGVSTAAEDTDFHRLVSAQIPLSAISWIRDAMRLILSAMSERELFLRTGYHRDEVRGAIQALDFHLE